MAVSDAIRRAVRQRAGSLCEYCHADERWQFVRFTIDHVVPLSSGGTDEIENLALACRNCNERRGNRCEVTDEEPDRSVGLFNPRRDAWRDHFAWSRDRTNIVGLTPCGSVTVQALDMNDSRHDGFVIRVRQRDVEDGYHPPGNDPILPIDPT